MSRVKDRVQMFREHMKRLNLDAYIIPSGDPHFGEYVQRHYLTREWISGFTGSAGTVVITHTDAALWTDSRYFTQAAEELEESDISLMRIKVEGTPSIQDWLKEQLMERGTVGADFSLISREEAIQMEQNLKPLRLNLTHDLFNEVWRDRPHLKSERIEHLPLEITGESSQEKLQKINNLLKIDKPYLYILSTCDDLSWLCNIRGCDIDYNPLPNAYAAFTKDTIYLFVGDGAITDGIDNRLRKEGIVFHHYNSFESFIATYPKEFTRVAPESKISTKLYKAATSSGAEFTPDVIRGGAIGFLKSLKNSTEIDGFKKAMLCDAAAWIKCWKYIEDNLFGNGEVLTERSIANKMIEFRSECAEYRGESFSPIVAFGKSAALPHYSTFKGEDVVIHKEGFLLIDTGAQYSFGTTDTTRTIALGKLSLEQKRDYTLVLKGMITLSMAKFPKGTRGASLDFLARGPICSSAKIYMHGTGHGIGHRLCVHEGPQSIRIEDNPVAISPGMVISNEPAVYEEGRYGIRIENTILCKDWMLSRHGEFYQFETLNFIPIDKKAIDKKILGQDCVEWLNLYHSSVYEKLSPYLDSDHKKWLLEKTSNLN